MNIWSQLADLGETVIAVVVVIGLPIAGEWRRRRR